MFRSTTNDATERQDRQVEEIRTLAHDFDDVDDLAPLIDRIGDARIVQLGEASHGTSDFYRWRAAISERLIAEHGFSFVAVEGDWPDCARVTDWLRDDAAGGDARSVLGTFERWPTWMWANEEVADFLDRLQADQQHRPGPERAGFFGLDVYSLWDSLRSVLRWLHENQPESVEPALEALRCFDPHGEDPQAYARAIRIVPDTCEAEVVDLLARTQAAVPSTGEGSLGEFSARQNAEVAVGAERYYRTMVQGGGSSWNIRDIHMADTLDRLLEHHGPESRAIVWAHNTHVGDARATDMASAGMTNLGQLARERHEDDGVVLVGFGSRHGTVVAGGYWGADAEVMDVPEAPPGTHEDLIHRATGGRSLIVMPEDSRDMEWPGTWRGHRAIGVVYHPGRDRPGNWVPTVIGQRYDAFIHLDETEALSPLLPAAVADGEPETYPWGT